MTRARCNPDARTSRYLALRPSVGFRRQRLSLKD